AASPNITAVINASGQLQIDADPGFEVSFAYYEDIPGSDEQQLIADTSGVLAVLGVNSLLDGTDAATIDLAAAVAAEPQLLSVGAGVGTNETALGLAALRDTPISALSDVSLSEQWQQQVERNAVDTAGAASRFDALSAVRQNLDAQDQAVSGVSLDEESIALITYQQQYNGAARFISVVDELTQVLFGLV
ncbi:MAG: flagellar basal body rod C-terminal domain-containing protein, partial [Planctomycetota bacterium]